MIKENAQIPKESHSWWFLISETALKESSGTGLSSLNESCLLIFPTAFSHLGHLVAGEGERFTF